MRDADPQITFADLEFLQQGIRLEQLLQKISDFLDDHAELVELVRSDLERGLKEPETGRPGLTPDQVLRSLILMRIKNWDYRELRERINDGYTLRKFTGFYSQAVPRHNAFNQAFNRLSPSTVETLNDAIIGAAVDDGLEDGKKLRADTTVVETDILRTAVRKMSNDDRIVNRGPTPGTPQFDHCEDIRLGIMVGD